MTKEEEQLAIQAIIDAGEITVGGMKTYIARLYGKVSGKNKGSEWSKKLYKAKMAKRNHPIREMYD